MKLKVNEIFQSIQGEGARAGTLNIFIRLSGCNLVCSFCDTEFESGQELTLDEILTIVKKYEPCRSIIWTGGEPALQLNEEVINFFKQEGYYQAIETNGSMKVPKGIDYIAVSPKVAEHTLEKNFKDVVVDELRYTIGKHKLSLPEPKIEAKHYFISPIFNGDLVDYENIKHCIELLKQGDNKWRLSVQLHKLLKLL